MEQNQNLESVKRIQPFVFLSAQKMQNKEKSNFFTSLSFLEVKSIDKTNGQPLLPFGEGINPVKGFILDFEDPKSKMFLNAKPYQTYYLVISGSGKYVTLENVLSEDVYQKLISGNLGLNK